MTGTLGGTAGGIAFLDISIRDINKSLCEFPCVTIGISGAELCSKKIISCATLIVVFVEEICGMLNCFGKNYTFSEISSTHVFGMYALWNL